MNDLYIGFMSGTSCDGVDASLIETDGKDFLNQYTTSQLRMILKQEKNYKNY